MRIKYRIKNFLQFMAFAFYPKTTLVVCTVISVLLIAVLAFIMTKVSNESAVYSILFALITGATASFFVSIIVEMSNNYRNNKLAWQELQDYYSVVVDYEGTKQVLLGNTASQRAEKKARDEFIDAVFKSGGITKMTDELMEELTEIAEEQPKDIIQVTWEQIPKIIPVLRQTYDEKKAFLNDEEIFELRAILEDYKQIRHEVGNILQVSPMLYDILNNPDEEYLNYPKNVLTNMPDWLRKSVASHASQEALERLLNEVMEDSFRLSYFMRDYDISISGLHNYHSDFEDEEDSDMEENALMDIDDGLEDDNNEDYDFYEPEDPNEHRSYHIEMDRMFVEENKPFVSWHISHCCLEIAGCMDTLERNILNKPFYGFHLKYDRRADSERIDDPLTDISYQSEKKRMKGILENVNK